MDTRVLVTGGAGYIGSQRHDGSDARRILRAVVPTGPDEPWAEDTPRPELVAEPIRPRLEGGGLGGSPP